MGHKVGLEDALGWVTKWVTVVLRTTDCSSTVFSPTCWTLRHPAAADALLDLPRAVPDAPVPGLHPAAPGARRPAAAGGRAGRPGAPLAPLAPEGEGKRKKKGRVKNFEEKKKKSQNLQGMSQTS